MIVDATSTFNIIIQFNIITDGAVGLVIPPTLVIDHQMQNLMTLWGTSFLHLDKTPIEDVAMYIQRKKPHILLSSIERLTDKSLLTELLTTKISYVAVDESQV